MLTIVTVTKNDKNGLKQTVRSTEFLRQLYQVKQIVVDGSETILQKSLIEMLNNEINIQYFWQKPDGVAKAFNLGIDLAECGWIWFLNGGDEVHPNLDCDFFLRLLQMTQAQILIFEIELHTGTITKRPPLANLWPPVYNWIPHPGILIKRNILLQVNGFRSDFNIAMDGELWFRLFRRDIATDLVSIPIAKFSQPGLSGDISSTSSEVKKAIEIHAKTLIKDWLKSGLRIFKSWYIFRKLSRKSSNEKKLPKNTTN